MTSAISTFGWFSVLQTAYYNQVVRENAKTVYQEEQPVEASMLHLVRKR